MHNKVLEVKQEANVYEAALERVRDVFLRYDRVLVSFSGGKDSTVVFQLAYQVAKEMNRLPLEVVFFDEEAIHPPTIEYVDRVSKMDGVKMYWYCLPVQHRNACSREEPYWYAWNPEKEDLWVRPLPEQAITKLKGFEFGMNIANAIHLMFNGYKGSACKILGIRTQESMRRHRMLTARKADNWISKDSGPPYKPVFRPSIKEIYSNNGKNNPHYPACKFHTAFPIYDWMTEDVWVATEKFGWDYNTAYDLFEKFGTSWGKQRVCQPFGEEPLRGIQAYAECFPEMWHKMLNRVPGVATAWRYGNSDLYSIGLNSYPDKFSSWKEYLEYILTELYPEKESQLLRQNANKAIRQHHAKSIREIEEEEPDPLSGISYKFLCQAALKGDYKGRKIGGMIQECEVWYRDGKHTLTEMIKKYGTEDYKRKNLEQYTKRGL